MPSPLYKPQYGALYKPMYGSQLDDSGGGIVVTWTTDATNGVAMPVNASEYTSWRTAYGLGISNPDSLFRCNEGSSASLGDSIGSRTASLTGNSTGNVAVPGWSTRGVKLVNPVVDWWSFIGENLSTTNVAAFGLWDLSFTPPLGDLVSFGGVGAANELSAKINSGGLGVLDAFCQANTSSTAGSYTGPTAVFFVYRQGVDCKMYVKQVGGSLETVTVPIATPSSGDVYLCNGFQNGTVSTLFRFEYWTGANANITAGQVSNFFTARGI